MLTVLYNRKSLVKLATALGLSALAGSMSGCASLPSSLGDEGPAQANRIPSTVDGQLPGVSVNRSAQCTTGVQTPVFGFSAWDRECGRNVAARAMLEQKDKPTQAVGLRVLAQDDPRIEEALKYVGDYWNKNKKLPPSVTIENYSFTAVRTGSGNFKLVREIGVSPNIAPALSR